jgi:circadian clock protein KaiB
MTTFEVDGKNAREQAALHLGDHSRTTGPHISVHAPRRAMDYVVRLYVAGGTPVARRAESSLRQLMSMVQANVELEVIDVVTNPAAAEAAGVLATPLVVREEPTPRRRIVGDLTDRTRLAEALGLDQIRLASPNGGAI